MIDLSKAQIEVGCAGTTFDLFLKAIFFPIGENIWLVVWLIVGLVSSSHHQ